MFTQFFGNYLFNEKLVTKQQLIEALEMQKFARAKLGVLAINAGYMTAAQVDEVHAEQQRMDKRFGDIAVEKGYMTESQVETLLSNQKQAHLVTSQTNSLQMLSLNIRKTTLSKKEISQMTRIVKSTQSSAISISSTHSNQMLNSSQNTHHSFSRISSVS